MCRSNLCVWGGSVHVEDLHLVGSFQPTITTPSWAASEAPSVRAAPLEGALPLVQQLHPSSLTRGWRDRVQTALLPSPHLCHEGFGWAFLLSFWPCHSMIRDLETSLR